MAPDSVRYSPPPEQNAEFVAAMEDVLDVYVRPYDSRFPVVGMDELSKQLIEETRTSRPGEPGQPTRFDSEYRRNGGRCVGTGLFR